MSSEYLLTFELGKDKNELHICSDVKGLEYLLSELSSLLEFARNKKTDHLHLFTEEWGGYELSSDAQVGELINHVKVYCWNEDELRDRSNIKN